MTDKNALDKTPLLPVASCCSPTHVERQAREELEPPAMVLADAGARHHDVEIPAGSFLMGDSHNEGYPADGELPVHAVKLKAFRMDATAVTNKQFAAFVEATGYRTEAEKYGTSAVFHLAVQAAKKDILGVASGSPWWLTVKGADWAHPTGPGQHWSEIPDHPVRPGLPR